MDADVTGLRRPYRTAAPAADGRGRGRWDGSLGGWRQKWQGGRVDGAAPVVGEGGQDGVTMADNGSYGKRRRQWQMEAAAADGGGWRSYTPWRLILCEVST